MKVPSWERRREAARSAPSTTVLPPAPPPTPESPTVTTPVPVTPTVTPPVPEAPAEPEPPEPPRGRYLLIDSQGLPYTVLVTPGGGAGGPAGGRRVLACAECGRSFAFLSYLQRHRVAHSPHKPHVCRGCGKGFKRPSHLRRHRGARGCPTAAPPPAPPPRGPPRRFRLPPAPRRPPRRPHPAAP